MRLSKETNGSHQVHSLQSSSKACKVKSILVTYTDVWSWNEIPGLLNKTEG